MPRRGKNGLLTGRMLYAEEKFSNAVEALAILPGDARSRLYWAYAECHGVSPEDIPSKVRRDWRWVKRRLQKAPPRVAYTGKRKLIKGSYVHIQNRTGSEIAKRILKIAKALRYK